MLKEGFRGLHRHNSLNYLKKIKSFLFLFCFGSTVKKQQQKNN